MVDTDKICLLLDSSGMGGIESHVLHLAQALRQSGRAAEVWFYQNHGAHPLRDALSANEIPLRCLDGRLSTLWYTLREQRPGLLHTHGYKAGIVGRLLGRLLRIPVVSTFHAGEPGAGLVRWYNRIDLYSAFLATGRIAVSDQIASRLPISSVTLDNFVPLPDEVTPAINGTVAFVGRLSHEKGPDLFCQLAEQCPESRFEVFGDGSMRATLEHRYADRVNFHGAVVSMQPHWSQVGLLCMSSRNEGLPLAALEAMAHGVPVAAFAVGALPKLIQDDRNGWTLPAGDVAALAQTIKHWSSMSREDKQVLSARAHNTVKERFSSQVVLPRVLEIYNKAGLTA